MPELAGRAAAHDRDGSFPFASADALAGAGYYAAPIPPELGGMGAESLHDVVVASSRLARADASLAIGVNMHMAALLNLGRGYPGGSTKIGSSPAPVAPGRVALAAGGAGPPPGPPPP